MPLKGTNQSLPLSGTHIRMYKQLSLGHTLEILVTGFDDQICTAATRFTDEFLQQFRNGQFITFGLFIYRYFILLVGDLYAGTLFKATLVIDTETCRLTRKACRHKDKSPMWLYLFWSW